MTHCSVAACAKRQRRDGAFHLPRQPRKIIFTSRHLVALLCGLVMLISAVGANATQLAARHASAIHGAAAPASTHPNTPASDVIPEQRITLHRRPDAGGNALISIGIPFPPGMLRDPRLVRLLDAHGDEIPAAVQTTLKWYAKDGSVRAVRVQFHAPADADAAAFYFAIGKPRQHDLAGWPYADGLVAGEQGLRVPAVVATLTPAWLCASLIAGPQWPAAAGEPYADYVATQFKWAEKLPVNDSSAWLFDRPSTLFKAYVRTGRFDYLQAAVLSYHFYMKYIRRDGLTMSPFCAGGWTFDGKPCDVKYVYVEPILLAVALTGDDSAHDTDTVDRMMALWAIGGWSGQVEPYKAASQYFTERLAGLGLLETVSAYELTGEASYRASIVQQIGWLKDHQQHNPDGLGDDGAWRSSWNLHENDSWNPATDVRGASTWMTENIIDGLWHAWLVTADPRIPDMITGYGRYLERYGWIAPNLLTYQHDWRNPCSGPNGQIPWYWSSSHAPVDALKKIEDSEGWYSDAHTVELALPVAAAYYFERDPKQAEALKRRLAALSSSYATSCATISETARKFNWNNRGSGVVQWLIRQPAGSGALRPAAVQAKQ